MSIIRRPPKLSSEKIVELLSKELEVQQLAERREKRIAVIEKHRKILDDSIVGKHKGIKFRKLFHYFVTTIAYKEFESEEEEYQCIGKIGKRQWTDGESHRTSWRDDEPMCTESVITDILNDFGVWDY